MPRTRRTASPPAPSRPQPLYGQLENGARTSRPKVFVAENVKGLLMSHDRSFFDQMLADFQLPGYAVDHKLYLAADYGVPQMRERILIVGVRGDEAFAHPAALPRRMTAKEALADLEDADENRATAHIWSKARRSPEQGNRRLKADKTATTIRAEHHGNVQWHYQLDRRISLREAARLQLQSFPDGFDFVSALPMAERPGQSWRSQPVHVVADARGGAVGRACAGRHADSEGHCPRARA